MRNPTLIAILRVLVDCIRCSREPSLTCYNDFVMDQNSSSPLPKKCMPADGMSWTSLSSAATAISTARLLEWRSLAGFWNSRISGGDHCPAGYQIQSDITRLGEPACFGGDGRQCGFHGDEYTANKYKRRTDDYTPGGVNNRRPDRAVMAYTNLIRRFYKNTRPIVLGGIEASCGGLRTSSSGRIPSAVRFFSTPKQIISSTAWRKSLSLVSRSRSKPETIRPPSWIMLHHPGTA